MRTAVDILIVFLGWLYIGACAPQTPVEVHSVDASVFSKVIENSNAQILDVRTRGEFLKGHLPNAINIDIKSNTFNETARTLLDVDRPVALYCQSGKRSRIAAGILLDMGYEVYELQGGVAGWQGPVSYSLQ